MDGADVCRTSSRASRRPPDVIAAVAILDSRWRRRKWHQPGLGVLFSIPSEVEVENGGPSASGRHLGWPHLQEPEMRSSKMATGSGRAAIFHLHLNGDWKKYPILLTSTWHYSAVIMDTMASQITSIPIVYSTVYPGADWPLCGEFIGHRWIPRTNGQ